VYIKELELTDFRSFRGTHRVCFYPGLNGIIGANGAGKSNLLEAVRFALEPSYGIYHGPREGLVWKDGAGRCSVTLTLSSVCGKKGDVTLRRSLSLAGEPGKSPRTYLHVDGNRCKLSEYHEMIRSLCLSDFDAFCNIDDDLGIRRMNVLQDVLLRKSGVAGKKIRSLCIGKDIMNVERHFMVKAQEEIRKTIKLNNQSEDFGECERIGEMINAVSERMNGMDERIAGLERLKMDGVKQEISRFMELAAPIHSSMTGGWRMRLDIDEGEQLRAFACRPGGREMGYDFLSAGDRMQFLLSIALALGKFREHPVLVFDQVDWYLDRTRADRAGAELKKAGTERQIIMVSMSRASIRHADSVLGVTMGRDGGSEAVGGAAGIAEEDRDEVRAL